ncbi:TPA: hypothetical protein SCV06_001627, partial [Campylobacter jejuni]|nr:hypothetical protein [Campylobacter jejuni]
RKSHLNSKKIVLSLAAISFLASCADAALNSEIKTYDEISKNTKARSASVYSSRNGTNTTINSLQNGQVTITGNGTTNSLTIGSNGTLGSIGNNDKIIYAHASNSDTLTLTNLTNNGIINGAVAIQNSKKDFTGTITVNTFENKNQINGQIYMGIWSSSQGTLNIENFNNSGTIAGSSKKGTVFFEGNTNIKSFSNNGLISGDQGIRLSGGTINSFNNNGTISGSSSSILVAGGNIKTLVNSGTIISNGSHNTNAGIKLESGGTIENIINTGTIQSNYTGIVVTYGKFKDLTVKDGGVVYGKYAGIAVGQWQTLGNLYIDGGKDTKKDGTVSGIYS